MTAYAIFLIGVALLNLTATAIVLARLLRRPGLALGVAGLGAVALWSSVALMVWGPRHHSSESLAVAGQVVAVARVEQTSLWVIAMALVGLLALYGGLYRELAKRPDSMKRDGG